MDSVEYDTNAYLRSQERAERNYSDSYREALSDVKTESYFEVRLMDLIRLAERQEIIEFYSRSVNPVTGDTQAEREEPTGVDDALKLKGQVEMKGRLIFGSDEYITEEGFPFIPSRIMPQLQRIEAERRVMV